MDLKLKASFSWLTGSYDSLLQCVHRAKKLTTDHTSGCSVLWAHVIIGSRLEKKTSPCFLNPFFLFGKLPNLGWPCVWCGIIVDFTKGFLLYLLLHGFCWCWFIVFIIWSKRKFWKVWCALVPICRPTINSPVAYACSCLMGNCSALSQSVLWGICQRRERNLWMVSELCKIDCWMWIMNRTECKRGLVLQSISCCLFFISKLFFLC